jgi:hypothetical protein
MLTSEINQSQEMPSINYDSILYNFWVVNIWAYVEVGQKKFHHPPKKILKAKQNWFWKSNTAFYWFGDFEPINSLPQASDSSSIKWE